VCEGEKDAKITGERDRSSCEEGVGEAVRVKYGVWTVAGPDVNCSVVRSV
jgi:hypothetical protein